jgi:hypothetical protein
MKIELHEIPIRDIVKDYVDNQEEGVLGYVRKLNIRPPYQREFVYKEQQRDAVIETWIDTASGAVYTLAAARISQ